MIIIAYISTAKGTLQVTAKTDEKALEVLRELYCELGYEHGKYRTIFYPEEAEKITTHDSTYAVHFKGCEKWNYKIIFV